MNQNLNVQSPAPANPKLNKVGLVVAVLTLGLVYGTTFIPAGLVSTALYLGAMAVTAVTALARLNDIRTRDVGLRWHVRRAGLALMGTTAITLSSAVLLGEAHPPEWREVLFAAGVAAVWITTPNMPPWWRWVAYKDAK